MATVASPLPRPRGLPRRALIALLALPLLLVLLVAGILADAPDCAPDAGLAGPMGDAIPAVYEPMYRQAETSFGVNRFLLASIHKTETDFGRYPGPGVTSGVNSYGCCAGPMQFNVRDGTWDTHKDAYRQGPRPVGQYPHRAQTHPSVYDPFDAIMAAGHKLAAQGADLSLDSAATRQAVFGYNHADSYVNAVLQQARTWQAQAAQLAQQADDGAALPVAAITAQALPSRASSPNNDAGSDDALSWPTDARTITSPFGPRSAPCAGCSSFHEGLDIGAPEGAPVHAAADGIVIFKGPASGYGNYLCLRHRPRLATCYAHLSRFAAQPIGATVRRGEVIGYVGHTGIGTGAHLHFEARTSGSNTDPAVDPLPYLRGGPTVAAGAGDDTATGCPTGLPADTAPPDVPSDGGLAWPTRDGQIIGHSNVPGSTHDPLAWPPGWQSDNALDIAVPVGTPIFAVADGHVCASCGFGALSSRSPQLAGLRLTLSIAGNAVYYAHLSRLVVRPGQRVRRGELLGYSGSANGVAHLHIAVRVGTPEALLGTTARPNGIAE